jgi:hypothetical protein
MIATRADSGAALALKECGYINTLNEKSCDFEGKNAPRLEGVLGSGDIAQRKEPPVPIGYEAG